MEITNYQAELQELAEKSIKVEDPTESTLRLVTGAITSQEVCSDDKPSPRDLLTIYILITRTGIYCSQESK